MDQAYNKLKYYPFALDLKDRRVLVIGGGAIAERKVMSLLESQALIYVISPSATVKLRQLSKTNKLVWLKRVVSKPDIQNAFLIIAATNDNKTNSEVSTWAKDKRILVNVVDKPALSDFISSAYFYAKDAIVTVYTDGKDPVLSRDLKNFLKEKWSEFLSYRNKPQASSN